MIRVLIADDHPAIQLGLQAMVDGQDDLALCGCVADGAAACALTAESAPDVVLMDVAMPGMDGIEATRWIRSAHPGTRVLMLSWSEDVDVRRSALSAGAAGYLLKDTDHTALLAAIHAVDRGELV